MSDSAAQREKAREAVEFLRIVEDAESDNRAQALKAQKFRLGDQWDPDAMQARLLQKRPCLTINKVDAFVRQVTNQQKRQKPRIMVHPVGARATVETAKVIQGICRHVEVNSQDGSAYDTAFDHAATFGWGYWRLNVDYCRPDSFDLDITLDEIENPFTVYFDPMSSKWDGSDARGALITDIMRKDDFRRQFPGADDSLSFQPRGSGDFDFVSWYPNKEQIRIAEYFYVDERREKLFMLSNGETLFESDASEAEFQHYLDVKKLYIHKERLSNKRIVKWRKQTAVEVLEEKVWMGRWIPIVPVYWQKTIVDGRRKRFGMIMNAMDPQKMFNYWRTSITESIALAPRAKWLVADGQTNGYEDEWQQANTSSRPVLTYKVRDADGNDAPMPQRIAPEMPPAGAVEAAEQASQDLQAVIGIFDPAVIAAQFPKSGKAIRAEQGQSDNSNFHGFDQLTKSIAHTGRIILDLIPKVYSSQRIVRIIGDDGSPSLVTVNEVKQDAEGVQIVKHDMSVGDYDVVMDSGPGYETKRAEGVDAMMSLLQTALGEKVAQVADDLVLRQMDFPTAEAIADRLAAANPLAQMDEESDLPPAVQMQIKSLQQQLQQAGQVIQELQTTIKTRRDVEELRQEGETRREHMRQTVKAHDVERFASNELQIAMMGDATKQHDTAMRAHTTIDAEAIKGVVAILLKHIDGKHAEAAMDHAASQADKEIESASADR